jgi:hypothetical protein
MNEPYPNEIIHADDFERHVSRLCEVPGMIISPSPVSLESVLAYLQGFNNAQHGAPLLGLHEWLVVHHSGANNTAWEGNIRPLLRTCETRDVIASLGDALAIFFEYRRHYGITKIYYDYAQFLLSKPYYNGPLREVNESR